MAMEKMGSLASGCAIASPLPESLRSPQLKSAAASNARPGEARFNSCCLELAAVEFEAKKAPEAKVCKAGGWKTSPFIFVSEFCEKLAAGGLHVNLISYLTQVMHFKTVDAANTVTNFTGTSALTPLVGAFLADAYLGRYATIVTFSAIHLLGMTLLAMAALFPSLTPPQNLCPQAHMHGNLCKPYPASSAQTTYLYLSLALMALGSGGIRPCVSPFGAEQLELADGDARRHEKRMWGFFNWFYFSLSLAFLLAVTAVVYVQENVGWGWGFGIPALAMSLGIAIFLSGTPLYRKVSPSGSPLTRLARVAVAAVRNRHLPVPDDPALLLHGSFGLPHTDQLRFLDRAALATGAGRCPVSDVEELKCLLKMAPVWLATVAMHTSTAQQGTFTVQQARAMDRRIGATFQIPPGSFSAFALMAMLAFIPLYDRLLLPAVRRARAGRGWTPLERIGAGLVTGILAMAVAGGVEEARRRRAVASALWLVPQYGVLGVAEAFLVIGQLEFSYTQSPESLRSTTTALHWTTIAAGSYLSSLLVAVVNACTDWLDDDLDKGRLAYFYWMLAALNALNMLFFVACARWYKYVSHIPYSSDGIVTIPSPIDGASRNPEL